MRELGPISAAVPAFPTALRKRMIDAMGEHGGVGGGGREVFPSPD